MYSNHPFSGAFAVSFREGTFFVGFLRVLCDKFFGKKGGGVIRYQRIRRVFSAVGWDIFFFQVTKLPLSSTVFEFDLAALNPAQDIFFGEGFCKFFHNLHGVGTCKGKAGKASMVEFG